MTTYAPVGSRGALELLAEVATHGVVRHFDLDFAACACPPTHTLEGVDARPMARLTPRNRATARYQCTCGTVATVTAP